jgi:hypothetical protein
VIVIRGLYETGKKVGNSQMGVRIIAMSRKKRASRKRTRSWRNPTGREIEDFTAEAPPPEEAPITEENSGSEDDSDDNGLEVHFDAVDGRLELSCEPGSFGLIRDLIVGLCKVSKIERDDIRIIEIRNDAAIAEHKERAPRWFSYGCLATVLAAVISAVIGVVTIIRWIIHR